MWNVDKFTAGGNLSAHISVDVLKDENEGRWTYEIVKIPRQADVVVRLRADETHTWQQPRGVHSLFYFAYSCVRDLFIRGVIYLAKKILR